MNSKAERILSLVCMAAVIAYTISNYLAGRSSIGFVIATIAFIGLPMLNILRLLLNQDDDK